MTRQEDTHEPIHRNLRGGDPSIYRGEETVLLFPCFVRLDSMMKSILTLRIDKDLHNSLKRYAKENHTTVTGLITQYAFNLQKRFRNHDNNPSISNLPNNEAKTDV